ncbi:DUF3575 domain-containing protein [Niabella sp. CC-SYL272]|uniref:DUF3575 domain-containing protein n=1 Tax=Niabella agricola TaxID=2891571 RepID=UPI001F1D5D9F|nr:DUF3575 domain-containing protein [Niabella agricola]MCF3110773.1 DUF3575 domain-containing protein [Niabella agricola]
MKKLACLLFVVVCCSLKSVSAQEVPQKYRTALKLNLAAAADEISFPTIRLALEYAMSRRVSLSGELGYQFYSIEGYAADPGFAKEKGIKANIELRRYARRSRSGNIYPSLAGFYTGLNFLYAQNRRNFTAYYYKKSSSEEYTDRFYARKTITGLNFVLGYQLLVSYPTSLKPGKTRKSERLLLDLYGSLGPAYRNNKNYNREYNAASDSLLRSRHPNVFDGIRNSYLEENSHVTFRPALGIRIGYRL